MALLRESTRSKLNLRKCMLQPIACALCLPPQFSRHLSALFATLPNLCRKTCVLNLSEATSVSTPTCLQTLRDALFHVVRNSVAHGIEPQSERKASEKPLQGCVQLRVERRGNRAAFICTDDGRGIDVEAVRRAAVRRGLVAPADATALGLEEAVRILMKGGVTTRGSVDEVSGRGIGLDVVRETAVRLKGEVKILSELGKGTSLEICVPVSGRS